MLGPADHTFVLMDEGGQMQGTLGPAPLEVMTEPTSQRAAADDQRELDEIAAELYALLPDAFAAARDDDVRKARAEGRQQLARELSRLRRPTQSAWLVNLLWRDQRDVMEQLLQLADDLSRAQAQASVPELRRLTAQRRELEASLLRGAHALAERAGINVTAAMEREALETLAAALARPDVANEVRTGRLLKPASYAGFGPLVSALPLAGAQHHVAEDAENKPRASSRRPQTDDLEGRAARRARDGREEAERRVQEARTALEAAAGALADGTSAVEAAHRHHAEVRRQIEQLREQLRDLQKEAAAAEHAAHAAARRRDEAEKAHEAALRTLERAEQDLKE